MDNPERALIIPPTTNIFGLPNDKLLLNCYPVYKANSATKLLLSERNRSILPEVFFEKKLKLLADLCVRALATGFGPVELPPILADDKLKVRLFFDGLSVDLPLDKISQILDEDYWKRTVLSFRKNVMLALCKNYEWKLKAISDKLTHKVESSAVETWSEDELSILAEQIKEFVTEITLKHLQPLQEESFEKYFKVIDPDVTSSEEEDEEENIKWKDLVENYEEFVEIKSSDSVMTEYSRSTTLSYAISEEFDLSMNYKEGQTEQELKVEEIEAEIREYMRTERIKLIEKREREKAEQKKRREEREIRRIEREEREAIEAILAAKEARRQRRLAREADPPPRKKKKPPQDGSPKKHKKKKKKKKQVEIEEEPKIIINYEEILARRKLYNYPPKDCHHIDLNFLRLFENLETITMEFEGPRTNNFHPKYFNFSYKDMRNLAAGISHLKNLKIFQLRNSRMDALKFDILLKSLQNIDTIEYLDFGYDFIGDDSALTIYTYLKNAHGITRLELEGNRFQNNFLKKLAYGLYQYKDKELTYLGLGHNILNHEGVHALIDVLVRTNHVRKLDLTGTVLDPEIISCCIAKTLIREHTTISFINLMAIPLDWQSSVDIVTALGVNKHLVELDIRGSGIDSEIEYEIELLLRRNFFLRNNPYIWDSNITEQELYKYLKSKRNPLLTKAKKCIEKRIECLKNRPNEMAQFSVDSLTKQLEFERRSLSSNVESYPLEDAVAFEFKPDKFNEDEFFKHLYVPGPAERFYYIQTQKRQKHELNMLEL